MFAGCRKSFTNEFQGHSASVLTSALSVSASLYFHEPRISRELLSFNPLTLPRRWKRCHSHKPKKGRKSAGTLYRAVNGVTSNHSSGLYGQHPENILTLAQCEGRRSG
ncbi:hypothetical protein JTE90_026065 [Oedothorax gibbosus]|uniref:Uncharacterized protein n=1 Tax=Oedothorax gibbosus TaxID=931172 RepID=A0AAV6TRX0_9ARAC|nr:hypothetical protein JTE90_026065 [Oedothorax gibbosus]